MCGIMPDDFVENKTPTQHRVSVSGAEGGICSASLSRLLVQSMLPACSFHSGSNPLFLSQIKKAHLWCTSLLVPKVGFEPTRYRYHRILSPARLPIPSLRHNNYNLDNIAYSNHLRQDYGSAYSSLLIRLCNICCY